MVEKKKLYLIYDCKDQEIYGWTENENIAKQFMEVRKHDRFIMTDKKFKIKDTADDFEYRKFCADNSNKHLFANYLGRDGEKMLSFITTTYENMKLEEYCDKTYDNINDFQRSIFINALEEEIVNAIEYMHSCATKNQNEYISFDSFMVFMMLFGDTVL